MAMRDAAELHDADVLSTGVCVVGGGPAGIALALSLDRSGVPTVLLESGGERQSPENQDLNAGAVVGLPYYALDETRHRSWGGTSNRWAGWSRPLDREDFEFDPGDSWAGWPLTYEDLEPWYAEAFDLCEVPTPEPRDHDAGLPAIYRHPFVGDGVDVAAWAGSPPTKFGVAYRADIESSKWVDAYLNATAVGVELADSGTAARGVRAVTPTGASFRVEADVVVLAAGAIETTRLLLASRDVHADGIGNVRDLVGRTFMEHPHLVTARLLLLPPEVTGRPAIDGIDRSLGGIKDRLAMQRPAGSQKVAYVVAPDVRKRLGTLNFSTHIQTVSKVDRSSSQAYRAFKLIVGNLRSPRSVFDQARKGNLPEGTSTQVRELLSGLPEVAQVVWEEALRRPTEIALYTQCEQRPNWESRVTLDPRAQDANGMPRVELSWRLSAADKESVQKTHTFLAEHYAACGLGVLVPEEPFLDDGPDWGPNLRGGHHHMGTARMSHDPSKGVVDPNNRVHGVDGLYIGDSSVFPTVGYANPLLTNVALARRLGGHLAQVVSRPAASV